MLTVKRILDRNNDFVKATVSSPMTPDTVDRTVEVEYCGCVYVYDLSLPAQSLVCRCATCREDDKRRSN